MEYKDPAMVMVGFSRMSCTPAQSLFGSSVKHNTIINLCIKTASVKRNLSSDWYHGEDMLIEVQLSPNQFAELLTSMNVSDGVPATLSYYNHEHFENPVLPTKAEQFRSEVEESLNMVLTDMKKAHKTITAMLEEDKPIGKKAQQELKTMINSFNKLLTDHLPFIMNQFSKQMNKTVQEAKAEVDSFVLSTIMKTGVETLKNNAPRIESDIPLCEDCVAKGTDCAFKDLRGSQSCLDAVEKWRASRGI